jgi:hypothetical protein
MAVTIDAASALTWRMHRHFLEGERASSVEQVVGRLVAVPSWSGDAELAVGLRMANPARGAVATALEDRRVIKTFAFRGAMNFFTPEDAGDYLALRSAGRQWELPSWREFYRIEPEDWPALREVVRDAVASGPLTQSELATAIASHPRFTHLHEAISHRSFTFLKPFAWQGDVSLGPTRDGEAVLQSLADAPGWAGIPSIDEAGPRAIAAYLSAYGPATASNLQYWLGECLSAGKRRITAWLENHEQLATVEVNGTPMFCLADQLDEIASTPPSVAVHLLPGVDQWVMGPGTADGFIVPPAHRTEATRGANLVVEGGRVVGTWKRAKRDITVTPFDASIPPAKLAPAIERIRQLQS